MECRRMGPREFTISLDGESVGEFGMGSHEPHRRRLGEKVISTAQLKVNTNRVFGSLNAEETLQDSTLGEWFQRTRLLERS